MKTNGKWIIAPLVAAIVIYLLSTGPEHLLHNSTLWEFREQLVFFTGLCAMLLMALSMVISVRVPWINKKMHGLDKAYVVHKWAGITATLFMLLHWLCERFPEWLVEFGVIPNPGELTDGSSFADWQIFLFTSGTFFIEVVFYGIILLVLIALWGRVSYSVFRKTHKVFPLLFLVAAYHGATAILKERWYAAPAGWIVLLIAGVGSAAAVMALFQLIGHNRKRNGIVESIDATSEITHLIVKLNNLPFEYQAGQYVFLRFEHDTEPHPFTIASFNEKGLLRFAIKGLGDFTGALSANLKKGQRVEVEGPYGAFDFNSQTQCQVWVAGGIGITPFLARLEQLMAQGGGSQQVYLWYCTKGALAGQFPKSLDVLCRNAGVELYHIDSTGGEYLTAEVIYNKTGGLKDTGVWFCGPPYFKQCLFNELKSIGFNEKLFYFDSFRMR